MKTSRAKRTPQGRLSYLQSKAAKTKAQQDRARRYALAARRPSTEHDPALSNVQITTRLVRQAALIIDQDPDLVSWVQDRIAATHKRPGRPREVTVRTGLICFVLQVLHEKNFLLFNLPVLLNGMPWKVRRNLGIDYLRNGQPTQVSYTQLLDLFHSMAQAFDAWDDRLDSRADEDAVRLQRASDLAEFVRRILTASNAKAPLWKGHGALDATMKWSWERPPGSLNKKIERRGADGDAGPPARLEEILGVDGDVTAKRVRAERPEGPGAAVPSRPHQAEEVMAEHMEPRFGVGGTGEQDEERARHRLAHDGASRRQWTHPHRSARRVPRQRRPRPVRHAGPRRDPPASSLRPQRAERRRSR